MAELEKLIERLKEIAEYFRGCRNNASFASKAENHFWELQNAASEAVSLLKAQEPRVMTLEEVEVLPYGYVLIETDKKDSLHWVDALLFCKNTNFSFDFITLEGRARLLGTDYNMEWRCWTSRPTDEQREAVKWA